MPQIPDYTSRVGLPTETGAVNIPGGVAAEPYRALAEGANQASNLGFAVDARLRQVKQVQELIDLKTRSTKDLYDLQSNIINSLDFIQNPEAGLASYETGVQKLRTDYLKGVSDDQVKAHFDEHFSNIMLSRNLEMKNAARKQRIESAKGTLDASLFALQQTAGKAQNQKDIESSIAEGLGNIDGMASTGVIGIDDVPKMKRRFVSGVGDTLVNRDIRMNPQEALGRLLGGAYDSIVPDEGVKEKLIEKAQRQADILVKHGDAEIARREARQERFAKRLQDQTEMDMYSRLNHETNPLSIPEIEEAEQNRILDASGARSLRKALQSEEGKDNKEILFAFEAAITDPNFDEQKLSELRPAILRAGGKSLSFKTTGELLAKARQTAKTDDVSKSPSYKLAADIIDDQLLTKGIMADRDPDEQARRASAKREFDKRVRAGEPPDSLVDDIVSRYRGNALTSKAFPVPRFMVDGTPDDLNALNMAEEATVSQFKSGYIDPQTFEREIENIKRLKEVAEEKQKREGATSLPKKPAAPGKPLTDQFKNRGSGQ